MILGIDGREMHKSFGNGIYLTDESNSKVLSRHGKAVGCLSGGYRKGQGILLCKRWTLQRAS
jgi:hypothetical protein